MFTHMRIAKPVTNLEMSFLMYSQGQGLHKIAEFNDHDGFNRITLGRGDYVNYTKSACYDKGKNGGYSCG
ncbi:TPA: hypothetical protein ACLFWE_004407, partial [Salmonella enterica subsp. houtenae serovar O:57:z4,z32:-]|nr:glyoxalase/bleomycin resistance protein/dioxygenase [Salmonella enterica subsp. houtenae serovar 50:g,z51:- str. 01-0133]VEA93451.1 Uncharacterised protein [Salmonella enterica subsp. houtenae]